MTVQWLAHRCEGAKKAGAEIETTKVDNKVTEWQWHISAGSRSGYLEAREYIKYCPYCGKRLDE